VPQDVIIGIDAGTSVIKALAFDPEGAQLAETALPNEYASLPGGGVEQDMARTWRDAARVLRQLADELDGLPERCAAIAVTGQGDGTWLIDDAGEPVAPAWLWLDSRAAPLVDELRRDGAGSRTYRLTGTGLAACQQGAHLAWLARHRPDVPARAATAFHCKDWLYFKLTGVRATDPSEGGLTFGDFRTRAYAPEILDALGIPELARLLPPMVDGVREWHPLGAEAAVATGLRPGTPVVLGAIDIACTALGGGLYHPGRELGCSIIGSTGMHMRLARGVGDVALSPAETGYTIALPMPDTFTQLQSNMAATLNVDWLVDLAVEAACTLGFTTDRKAALPAIDARILDTRPGIVLFHPFIHAAGERGPFVAPNARAQLIGLSREVGFLDLARAVYEGLAFAARDCYAAMDHRPEEVRISGGAARSRALRCILSSALGAPVRSCAREEAGAAGAAIMAAVALGLFPDIASACRTWVDPLLGDAETPDPDLSRRYDALFPVYQAAHRSMHPVWNDLARIRRELAHGR
jgi:erythritol kinase (D-erythritol 1-phosphate-forming)